MNTFKTFFLMLVMTVLFIWVGEIAGGRNGMAIAFVISAVMNFGSYWFSDKIVLFMYGAKQVSENELPQVYSIVRKLTSSARMPMPKICLMNTFMPNAFATGRNPEHAVVAVTSGLLEMLDSRELEGVLAHELAHVTNRDILISSIIATMAGAIIMIARIAQWVSITSDDRDSRGNVLGFLVLAILAPIAAMLIRLAISRAMEYRADLKGSEISQDPLGLASALRKLTAGNLKVKIDKLNPATAHMFIVNPLSGKGLLQIFSTHPPLESRIRRLEEMASNTAGRLR